MDTLKGNEKEMRICKSDEVNGSSILYMLIFYMISFLILSAMIFEFVALNNIVVDPEVGVSSTEKVLNITQAIPYEDLIYALILYSLGMFGIEGTRALIISLELKGIKEKAKNMPRYNRNRLIQMLFTFVLLAIISMVFQMCCVNLNKSDFHIGPIYAGITVYLMLLSYADFGPKLAREFSILANKNKGESEEDEECVNQTTEINIDTEK